MSEQTQKCLIRDFKEHFNFTQIVGDDYSLERWIIVGDVNRPGLELTGFFDESEPRRVVILGQKEVAYIKTLTYEQQVERFDRLTDGWTPCIVLARDLQVPEVLQEIAQTKNFPIFVSEKSTSQLMIDVVLFLDEKLSPIEYVHGVLVNVHGKGVLITGASGMGKSEIALELIKNGHILIADDRVDVTRANGHLVGQSPALLTNMLEVRGIGIINVAQMFGASAVMSKSQIDFNIELEEWDDVKDYLRVGTEAQPPFKVHGIEIDRLVFPVREGRHLATLVEAAVINFTLKKRGFDASADFEQRVFDMLLNQDLNS